MFIGIINNLGTVSDKTETSLIIKTGKSFLARLEKGMSVAVDGICLTVVARDESFFKVNIMPETINKTNIKYLRAGDLVNLELPAKVNSFLSGHIVQGHIDGKGEILNIRKEGNSKIFNIKMPSPKFCRFLVYKGSVAVEGISLTVAKVLKNSFIVKIIPYTLKHTNLRYKKEGNMVNLEFDILAKYLSRTKFLSKINDH